MDLKYSENYYIRVLLNKIKIEEIMIKNVISVDQKEPFSHVWEKFRANNIRHLPVVTQKKKLVGVITQRDLYRIQSPRLLRDGNWYYDKEALDRNIIEVVMTRDPFTLTGEDAVAQALLAMADRKYGCIPIVEKGKNLCGIITQGDILKLGAAILKEGS